MRISSKGYGELLAAAWSPKSFSRPASPRTAPAATKFRQCAAELRAGVIMRPFPMTNDARAKTASKDLQSILIDCGFVISLTQSQQLVAKMYGYQGWEDLRSGLGAGEGKDDGFVSASLKEERRQHQMSVLVAEQMDTVTASAVVARLRLTNRIEAPDINQRIRSARLENIADPMKYHPMRYDRLAGRAADRTSTKDYDKAVGKLVSGHAAKLAAPIEKASDYSVTCTTSPIGLFEWNDDALFLDASGFDTSTSDAQDIRCVERRPIPETYIHFGPGKFKSPYPGCWIEGCYIQVMQGMEDIHGVAGFAWIKLVSSGDLPYGRTAIEAFEDRLEVQLAQHLRTATYEVQAQEENDTFDIVNAPLARHDGRSEAFAPYAQEAIAFGWQALAAFLDEDVHRPLTRPKDWKHTIHAVGDPVDDSPAQAGADLFEGMKADQVLEWQAYYQSLSRMVPVDVPDHQFLLDKAEAASRAAARQESSPEP